MELIFSDETINDTDKKHIVDFITEKVEGFNLNLKDLEKIVLTKDYFEEVKLAWENIGKYNKGASNNSMGEGIGILISDKPLNPESKMVVLIGDSQWRNLLSENKKEFDFVIHVINHELAHAHDESIKHKNIYSEDIKRGYLSDLDFRSKYEADKFWSEYIAERLSSDTITREFIDMIEKNTFNQLSQLSNFHSRNNHFLFRVWKTEDNFDEFNYYMEYVLKSFAHLLGISHGLGKNHEWTVGINKKVRKWIGNSSLIEVWDSMSVNLSDLYDIYPDWDDFKELGELGKDVLQAWRCFGYFD
ncbi:hypothetical protein [Priestia megaterium]|uniref:hypothetical protein n=1 Tax=Priestia megaterium TaxID=1404 RepID=UPI000D51E6DF|nr:hypothetical protein [Priestia megaterium]PVE74443.1 hypothetical protein DC428_00610 [Priestia megaterium]PVE82378.1 hypothetical protein DC421_19800 [Priestia megaterium]PVE86964.1 hypothetical protein DC426_16805 [Priestia megaterium]PVE94441.1 hypothetical protein DC433_24905 [Priestia megaterium]